MSGELNGLTLVVVGGAAGLGRATVELAMGRGASLIGIIDLDPSAADVAVDEARAAGVEVAAVAANISTRAETDDAFRSLANRFERVDAVVNCAAVYPRSPLLEISDEAWDLANAINVKGTYHVMVAAVNHMKSFTNPPAVTGRIVNVTSVDAFKAHPQNAHYAATKAAVVSLTRSFAEAFATDQILINSVAPAAMATEKAESLGILPELANANPLGRAATPEEIAEWILMAAGPRNTYMTGESIIVSGGYVYA